MNVQTTVDPSRPAAVVAADLSGAPRDGRIDFIRGFACVSFITGHFEAFTWLHMVFWERLGFVSGAEVFVLLSGFLTGMVHRRLFERPEGAEVSLGRLWRRAATLYFSYVVLTGLVVFAERFTPLDLTAVSTFADRRAHVVYQLLPPASASLGEIVHNILLLRTTPHQVQILGLYAVLLALTPFALVLLRRGHAFACVSISVAGWLLETWHPMQPTGALFENGFPLLAWQLYFIVALVVGWHRSEIITLLSNHRGIATTLWSALAAIAVTSLILAQSTDNPDFPRWFRLVILPPEQFRSFYDAWLLKNSAGAGRVLCAVAFTVSFYRLLGICWPFAHRLLGGFLEPLGRSSLYVFLVHVPLIALVDQLPGYFDGQTAYDPLTVWPHTLVLCAMIATIWLMVRARFLFGIVPR